MSPIWRFPEFSFKIWIETPFRPPATKDTGSFLMHHLIMEVSLWFGVVEVQTQISVGWFGSWQLAYDEKHPFRAESFRLIRTSQCSPLGLPIVRPLTLGLFSRDAFAALLGPICSAFCPHFRKQPNSLSPREQLYGQLDPMITLLSSSLGGRRHFLALWLAKY